MASKLFLASLLFVQSSAELLRPESDLTHNCFGFPSSSFTRKNSIKSVYGSSPHTGGELEVGDTAIDFTLSTLEGKEVNLLNLINKKPVLLVWGMYTCPAFQGLSGEDKISNSGYQDEWDLVEKYKDDVHFVHLYGPEPHPLAPDVNFDIGQFKMNYWSTERQPTTMEDRVALATKASEYIHPSAHLLVDNLSSEEGAANQGVWCSMGLGARTSMLIAQNGKVAFKEDWFNAETSSIAIGKLLASSE